MIGIKNYFSKLLGGGALMLTTPINQDFLTHQEKYQSVLNDIILRGHIDSSEFKQYVVRKAVSMKDKVSIDDVSTLLKEIPDKEQVLEGFNLYVELANKINLNHLNNEQHLIFLNNRVEMASTLFNENSGSWRNSMVEGLDKTVQTCLNDGSLFHALTDKFTSNVGVHNLDILMNLSSLAHLNSELAVTLALIPKITFIVGALAVSPHATEMLKMGWTRHFLTNVIQKLTIKKNGPTFLTRLNPLRLSNKSLCFSAGVLIGSGVATGFHFYKGRTVSIKAEFDIFKGHNIPQERQELIKMLANLAYEDGLYISVPVTNFMMALRAPVVQAFYFMGFEALAEGLKAGHIINQYKKNKCLIS